MITKILNKRAITLVLVFMMVLNSFVFAQDSAHWAYKNYEYFKDKGVLKNMVSLILIKTLQLVSFKSSIKRLQIGSIEFESEPKELMTRADVARLLAVNLELDELFEISAEDYIDGEGLDESLK